MKRKKTIKLKLQASFFAHKLECKLLCVEDRSGLALFLAPTHTHTHTNTAKRDHRFLCVKNSNKMLAITIHSRDYLLSYN